MVCGHEVLVVKGWLGSGKWFLPGGGLHRNEDSIVGALRELNEEVGIQLNEGQLQYIGDGRIHTKGLQFAYEQFVAVLPTKPKLKMQKLEIIDMAWLPISALDHGNATPAVLDTIAAWQQIPVSDTMK